MMFLSALLAVLLQPAASATADPAAPVQLPSSYLAGVQKCLAEVPKPSGELYASLADLGRGPEADAKLEQWTTAQSEKYRECLLALQSGLADVVPRNAFQRRQVDLTRADLVRRLADVSGPFREMLTSSRLAFSEQPARHWAKLSLSYDLDWLAYEPEPLPSLADKCGAFDSSRVRLFPNDAARTNAVLKRAYAYRTCVEEYFDAAYELTGMIGKRLQTANRAAFYAPYVCGSAPAGHCIDRERWQAVNAKLPPDRVTRLKAMAARADPQFEEAERVKDAMEKYVENAQAFVARVNGTAQ